MERLWAPWRMAYIAPEAPGEGDPAPPAPLPQPACIFCTFPAENDDEARLIVRRGATCYVLLNAFPYNNGHLMVVPYRHVACLAELSLDERAELMTLAARMTEALAAVSRPDGYNLGMNLGSAAGAGIADHLHLHLVPRWSGDTNFMPVVGGVKVLPETLADVRAKLVRALTEPSSTES